MVFSRGGQHLRLISERIKMKYKEKGNLMFAIKKELERAKEIIDVTPRGLKDLILDTKYEINSRDDDISMIYTSRKQRRENRGGIVLGQVTIQHNEDENLYLGGCVYKDNYAGKLFKSAIHKIAHQFNINSYFDFG